MDNPPSGIATMPRSHVGAAGGPKRQDEFHRPLRIARADRPPTMARITANMIRILGTLPFICVMGFAQLVARKFSRKDQRRDNSFWSSNDGSTIGAAKVASTWSVSLPTLRNPCLRPAGTTIDWPALECWKSLQSIFQPRREAPLGLLDRMQVRWRSLSYVTPLLELANLRRSVQ